MAIVRELDREGFEDWLSTRPEIIQRMAREKPPDRLYRIGEDGHRVTIYSYSEDGTVTVNVTGEYNFLAFERRVFGIKLDSLQECDLPEPGEPLGSAGMPIEAVREALKRDDEAN